MCLLFDCLSLSVYATQIPQEERGGPPTRRHYWRDTERGPIDIPNSPLRIEVQDRQRDRKTERGDRKRRQRGTERDRETEKGDRGQKETKRQKEKCNHFRGLVSPSNQRKA